MCFQYNQLWHSWNLPAILTYINQQKLALIFPILNEKFPFIRRVKGDGNCYYRAVYYRYLETLICANKNKNNIAMLLNRSPPY